MSPMDPFIVTWDYILFGMVHPRLPCEGSIGFLYNNFEGKGCAVRWD